MKLENNGAFFTDHAAGQKEQEGNLAFDNRAYLSLSFPQDSGFDSYEPMKEKQFYENVKEQSDDQEEDFPSYENIEGSSESYENIRDPSSSQLNYQNLDFIPPPPILKSMPELREESYENVDFQKEIPVYAVPKKLSHTPSVAFEEEAPVYENYDFQVRFHFIRVSEFDILIIIFRKRPFTKIWL